MARTPGTHMGRDRLKLLWRQKLATGLKLTNPKDFNCESCIHGKGARTSFRSYSTESKSREILGRVSTDLCGPMSENPAFIGELYALIVLDQFSDYTEVFF